MRNLTLFIVVLVALMLVLGLAYTVSACYNVSDKYSYEIVLNKPGLKISIENLAKAGYVKVGNVYTKPSADPRVEIIASTISLDSLRLGSGTALSLRFQLRKEYMPVRGYLGIFLVENGLEIEKTYFLTENDVMYVFSKINGGVNVVAIALNYEGSLEEFKEQTLNYISHELKVSGEKIKIVSLSEINVPIVDLENIEWCSIVKEELKELISNGVVEGLSGADVEKLSEIAKPGLAGWNSRIVYYNGSWIPYYKTGNPMLLKCAPLTSSSNKVAPAFYEHTQLKTTVTTTLTTTLKPITTRTSAALKPTPYTVTGEAKYMALQKTTENSLVKLATIFIVGALLSAIAWLIARRII